MIFVCCGGSREQLDIEVFNRLRKVRRPNNFCPISYCFGFILKNSKIEFVKKREIKVLSPGTTLNVINYVHVVF